MVDTVMVRRHIDLSVADLDALGKLFDSGRTATSIFGANPGDIAFQAGTASRWTIARQTRGHRCRQARRDVDDAR